MFVKAIEEVSRFTRPLCTIGRNYGETNVVPGSATIFFVNENGYAVTCNHVAQLLAVKDGINEQYSKFRVEKEKIGKNKHNKRIKELETRYGYKQDICVELDYLFVNCTHEPSFKVKVIPHPKYDLAIIIFEDFKASAYQSFAQFIKDTSLIKPGEFLCRLGFPFPEFSNFRYNDESDNIEWTDKNQLSTPVFPLEGMLTRNLSDGKAVFGYEISTPGLRGQSGGPLFNQDGLICGMQSATNHFHLGFDMKNFEYNSGGKMIKINNQPFLHVGHCINVEIIKEFLKENGVKYYES